MFLESPCRGPQTRLFGSWNRFDHSGSLNLICRVAAFCVVLLVCFVLYPHRGERDSDESSQFRALTFRLGRLDDWYTPDGPYSKLNGALGREKLCVQTRSSHARMRGYIAGSQVELPRM